MKLIALCVMRDEAWVIGASLRACLKWTDGAAILLDRCTDRTEQIIREVQDETDKEILVSKTGASEHWEEMTNRQKNLDDARSMGATHLAIVDADEILLHQDLPLVRGWFQRLNAGQVLDVAMIAPWKSLDVYSKHTQGIITLGFKDMPGMGWAPRGSEKYHHHNRPPHGMTSRVSEDGGVMHLQFAAWNRFIWKHRHYMMSEVIRWGYPPSQLNSKYHWWDQPPHGTNLLPIPKEWWGDYPKDKIDLNAHVWYESECKRMATVYGMQKFVGLDLFGMKLEDGVQNG